MNRGFLRFAKLEVCGQSGAGKLGTHNDLCFQTLGHSKGVSVSGQLVLHTTLTTGSVSSAQSRASARQVAQDIKIEDISLVTNTPDAARSESH